jgi:hypothetical protein
MSKSRKNMANLKQKILLLSQLTAYNIKIIFSGKFVYFMLAAVLFFLFISTVSLLNEDSYPDAADIYYILLLPGLLLIFYPSSFGIQNDTDIRMIEMLFGVPNYRYKVWLVRLAILYILVNLMLMMLSLLSSLLMVPVSAMEMSFQLMFPVFFLGALSFMFSTLIRNGNGTAGVMAIVGLIFWIMSGLLEDNEWNIFLNPFESSDVFSQELWIDMIFYNRLYLIIGTILAILLALNRLQQRERFV